MLIVGSEGMGGPWAGHVILPLLKRTFPHTEIILDDTKKPNLVLRSHFTGREPYKHYSCPYIVWSGEPYRVPLKEYDPLIEINTFHDNSISNNLHIPFLIFDNTTIIKKPELTPKTKCCAFAYSRSVNERERFFTTMRSHEPTCYAFGNSCHTNDNPFILPISQRKDNKFMFKDFAFVVAMENCVKSGYITEKIGNAFNTGSVPIYWGDSDTVSSFFNPESYIDVSLFSSPEAAAEYAVQVWKDPHKLQKYLDAPMTLNTKLEDYFAVYTDYRPWQKPFVDILRDTFPDLS